LKNQLSAKSEALKSHSSELYKATETLALAVNQTRSLLWQLNDLLKDQKRDSLLTSDQFHIDSVKVNAKSIRRESLIIFNN
jgi:hypothetical protein